ncbi:MAG: hypothetical protein E6R03_02285 [Hyphomicrobiaceae bacterium]|nr:MAG: hypothetical protein E6R03_02285 [Hyphomicrobiaceae bacterium]
MRENGVIYLSLSTGTIEMDRGFLQGKRDSRPVATDQSQKKHRSLDDLVAVNLERLQEVKNRELSPQELARFEDASV